MFRKVFLVVIFCSSFLLNALAQKPNTAMLNQLKVITYNIHHANPPSKPGFIDLDAIANVINNEKPDLVALQEVEYITSRTGNVDQAKVIAEKTGMHYKFFKAIDYAGGAYGLAILSRFPIIDSFSAGLPQVKKSEDRILAYVQVTLANKQQLIFANTHLDAQGIDSNRVVQIKKIVEILTPLKKPIIICGDFNSEANKETIRILDQEFKRTCLENCEGTLLSGNKLKTIDYIALKGSGLELVNHKVIDEKYASDHKPVLSVYNIKN